MGRCFALNDEPNYPSKPTLEMDLPHRLIVLFSFATFDLFSKAEQRSQRAQDRSRHWVPALDDRTDRPNILGGGSKMNEYGLLPSGNIMNIYIYI